MPSSSSSSIASSSGPLPKRHQRSKACVLGNTVRAQEVLGGPPEGPASKHHLLPSAGGLGCSAAVSQAVDPAAAGSSDLAGLAALLATSGKELLALESVVTALAGLGIVVPEDLAFVGSGDELPSGTIDEIRAGREVEGFDKALVSMFQAARAGLDGKLTILARRISTASAPIQSSPPSRPCTPAMNRAEKRVLLAIEERQVNAPRPDVDLEAVGSLAAKEQKQLNSAIERCFRLLEIIGDASPRWSHVFTGDAARRQASRRLQSHAFVGRFRSHRSIDNARRKFEAYVRSMGAMKEDPFRPSEWVIAAFIADQAHKSPHGPSKMLHALSWSAGAFDLNLQLDSALVKAQRSVCTSVTNRAPPKTAKMATTEMLRIMEDVATSSTAPFWRCWAGVFAALGHGVLRWSDLQHSKDLTLTSDAVFGTTWRMKGKTTHVPWAALRFGLSGSDWGYGVVELAGRVRLSKA